MIIVSLSFSFLLLILAGAINNNGSYNRNVSHTVCRARLYFACLFQSPTFRRERRRRLHTSQHVFVRRFNSQIAAISCFGWASRYLGIPRLVTRGTRLFHLWCTRGKPGGLLEIVCINRRQCSFSISFWGHSAFYAALVTVDATAGHTEHSLDSLLGSWSLFCATMAYSPSGPPRLALSGRGQGSPGRARGINGTYMHTDVYIHLTYIHIYVNILIYIYVADPSPCLLASLLRLRGPMLASFTVLRLPDIRTDRRPYAPPYQFALI